MLSVKYAQSFFLLSSINNRLFKLFVKLCTKCIYRVACEFYLRVVCMLIACCFFFFSYTYIRTRF